MKNIMGLYLKEMPVQRFFITVNPSNIAINQKAKNIKKITLATEAAPAAIPVNPKIAAMIAITKNMAAHLNIVESLMMINNNIHY